MSLSPAGPLLSRWRLFPRGRRCRRCRTPPLRSFLARWRLLSRWSLLQARRGSHIGREALFRRGDRGVGRHFGSRAQRGFPCLPYGSPGSLRTLTRGGEHGVEEVHVGVHRFLGEGLGSLLLLALLLDEVFRQSPVVLGLGA